MSARPATRVYVNAAILTMDATHPTAEALAVSDRRVLSIGSQRAVLEAAGSRVMVVDLQAARVIPGFNDCHMHVLALGLQLGQVDLRPPSVTSIPDIRRAIAERAGTAESETWVRGRGYNHDFLAERRHPTRLDLDEAGGDHPVVISHMSGHVLTCNSVALRLAGLDRNTETPPGGEIEHGPDGEPTGVLKETAMPLVLSMAPKASATAAAGAISAATAALASEGITSAADAATGHDLTLSDELAAYRSALDSGELRSRITLMPEIAFVAPPHEDKAVSPWDFDVANQPDWLRIGPTKIFADGAITTRTAALRRPYVDSEGAGLPTYDPDSLASMVRRAHANGWQVATHAMGDRAIDMVLDAYEQAQQAVPRPDPRHRIEHCSLPDPDLCRRIESLGVVPVMQPELLGRFGDSYIEGLGPERAAHAMPVGWLRRLGVPVAFSSDRPVVSGSPKFGIWSALSRTTPSGRVLGPAHRVDAEQALCSYTANAAYAGFLEHSRGRLAPGFLADFAVLDRDIVTCARDEILDARVVMTVVGGEVVYEA